MVLGVICCDRKCSCGLDRPFLARTCPASCGFVQHVDAATSLAGLDDCAALLTLVATHPTRDHAVCDPEKVSTLLSMVNLPRARETVAWAVAERARVNIRGCVTDIRAADTFHGVGGRGRYSPYIANKKSNPGAGHAPVSLPEVI